MSLGTAVSCAVFLEVLLFSSVIQHVSSQQQQQHQSFLLGSPDTFVEPFGSVTLSCQVDPGDLPKDVSNSPGISWPLFQWRFRKTGQLQEENFVTWGAEKWVAQQDIMNVLGDQRTGLFNLQITNVSYDSHDGDYYCEVNIPAIPGVKRKVLRSKPFHLYVKYQPQSPQVDFSVSPDNLREDQRLVISCSSRDGNPPPEITWLRNGIIVPSIYVPSKNRQDVTKADLVLDPLKREHHHAAFTCRVSNPAISQPFLKSIDPLDVKYKPRIKVAGFVGGVDSAQKDSLTGLSVETGTEVKLSCIVDANPQVPTPSWRKNGQLFQQNAFNYTFTPGSLTRDSAGVYSCVASNNVGGEQSSEIKIDVFYAPIVTIVPPIISLREGGTGNLRCQVDSNPKAEAIEWFNSHGDRIATTDFLTLSDVKKPEAGNYECRARTHFQPSGGNNQVTREGRATGRVDVQYRPGVAIIEPVNPRVLLNSRVSLRCSASDSGLPSARFRWRKLDGRPSSIYSSSEFLNITDAKLDDNGDYECTPFNEVGDGTPKVVRLEVSEPASWTSDNTFTDNIIRRISDKPLGLICSARGRPAPQFKWFKDTFEIAADDRLYDIVTSEPSSVDRFSFVTRSELRFEGPARTELFSANDTLQRTDRGRYSCKAFNDAGQPVIHETNILLQYPPEFRNRHTKAATDVSPATSTNITCLVASRPPSTISWTRNGQPVLSSSDRVRVEPMQIVDEENFKSILILDSVVEGDLGDYRCSATNLIGDNTMNLSLVRRSIPDQPRNLKQKDVAFDGVTLMWDSGFDGGFPQTFTVFMTKPDGSVQQIPVQPSDGQEFRVTGLLPLSTYTFQLKSENQMGPTRGSSGGLDVRTPSKPISMDDIPKAAYLKLDQQTGLVSFGSRENVKALNLCALIDVQRASDQQWTPVSRCVPFSNGQGAFQLPGAPLPDAHPRIRFCLSEKQDVCGEPVDEQSILQQASTATNSHLDIILPVVLIFVVLLIACMVICVVCRRRARKMPVKTVKASNLTLTTNGSIENGVTGGFYADGYTNKALGETANGLYAAQNPAKFTAYNSATENHYGNGLLYAQVDKKLSGDGFDNGMGYKPQLTDLNGNLYSGSNLHVPSYPGYDDGYSHQHSPLDSSYTIAPVEISGLPDPYEDYEKTPSFGEESVESGYSTSNSRGRRVIREIIV